MNKIRIKHASVNNLQAVNVEIPTASLVVISGVSGSGKSSLAFDTLYRESQRRYLSSLSSYARHFLGKLSRPEVQSISGLPPAIALDQKSVILNPRSTVGTLSAIYDYLRLLFSRVAQGANDLSAQMFSFNSPQGACSRCRGLGVVDQLDPALLVADSSKTLRQGALRITTPSGYIIYSQVTMEVLDQVCQAHGFNVDIPWQDLSREQQQIVLFGSQRIKIPFGKHTLSSRMKWSGITAKPREQGYYKGIVPVMEQILQRDRNKNILRFVRSVPCAQCCGARLNQQALACSLGGRSIAQIVGLSIESLQQFLCELELSASKQQIAQPLIQSVVQRTALLQEMGLGFLSLDHPSSDLSGAQVQRIRLANQINAHLQDVLYVLDEPTIGLHPIETKRLIQILRRLRDNGNTVVVVEHDPEMMRQADWIIDLGPQAGVNGGQILFQGPPSRLVAGLGSPVSLTGAYLFGQQTISKPSGHLEGTAELWVRGARQYNLRNIDAVFRIGALNVVSGLSGSGKSTLVKRTLARGIAQLLDESLLEVGLHDGIDGAEQIDKLISIDRKPIGKTPRSNPATYTKLFDLIRERFAQHPLAIKKGWDKSRFSFNVPGGRCEVCQGAGVQQVGMHFLADVETTCENCGGMRFDSKTLAVRYRDLNVFEVLSLSVEQAALIFADQRKMMRILRALLDVGLGYLALGQPSSSLSGGEAQRVKIASHLARPASGRTLYILDEPTTGLHTADLQNLLRALGRLAQAGNTLVVIENNLDFIKCADWLIELGPSSGSQGGKIIAQGSPTQVTKQAQSLLSQTLRDAAAKQPSESSNVLEPEHQTQTMQLRGVQTNNLKNVDVDIPHKRMIVITGVSGSGKSSLAFDTIYAEGLRRFTESLSTHARRTFRQLPKPQAIEIKGLGATIGLSQKRAGANPRSTVATLSEVYDYYRLLYSRAGELPAQASQQQLDSQPFNAQMFSFNHHLGSCKVCKGLGNIPVCDVQKLITHPDRSLFDGALAGHKTGRFYTEANGKHLAILEQVGRVFEIDFRTPWCDLSEKAKQIAVEGTGPNEYDVVWKYNRKGRRGEHCFRSVWLGFAGTILEEYNRVHADKRGERLREVLKDQTCPECHGDRLDAPMRLVFFGGLSLGDLTRQSVSASIRFFQQVETKPQAMGLSEAKQKVIKPIRQEIQRRLGLLEEVGLGYLQLDRLSTTLSGGERQRLRLATQLGSPLCGITYVLDEPTIGLHAQDTQRLIHILQRLRAAGNTLVVVEHDTSVIQAADHVIELGPGAGRHGGQVIACGSVQDIVGNPRSLTGALLFAERRRLWSGSTRKLDANIQIIEATQNNLKGFDVSIPLGALVVVTGLSGSGKSSLVFDVLAASFGKTQPIGCRAIKGLQQIDELVALEDSAIGSTPLSTPATYSRVFERIRELFASTQAAKQQGYKKAHFSHNSKGARCEACRGWGQIKVEMGFVADVWVKCEDCQGKRYQPDILSIRYNGLNIAEVLMLTIDQASRFFAADAKLARSLDTLSKAGLGYLELGQSATTLSGGESQRLKLATQIIQSHQKRSKSLRFLYLFDEPTCGLHARDVACLLQNLRALVESGHSVVVVEHNLDVIQNADWLIDLGPEGGDRGGEIIAVGTPESIASCPWSKTGQALAGVCQS